MITGIAHAAFAVSDLERTLDFYCHGLGLREAFRLHHDDGTVWIVYVQIRGLDFIEFFPEHGRAASTPAPSYRHLALDVDDMGATLTDLASRGIRPERPPVQGKDGNWQAWLVDPDGNRIELMQVMPDSPQAEAARRGD
jgi:lactoylglutathione lyase